MARTRFGRLAASLLFDLSSSRGRCMATIARTPGEATDGFGDDAGSGAGLEPVALLIP